MLGLSLGVAPAQANPGAHGYSSETVYVVGNEEPSWSRASDFSRFQVVQSSAGEATFSRVYQLRPTSSILGPGLLLRSGFSEWCAALGLPGKAWVETNSAYYAT